MMSSKQYEIYNNRQPKSDFLLYLRFRYNFHSNRLVFKLALFASGRASMTKMPSPYLFPKLVLGSEILAIAEALVQSLFRLGSGLLGDRALLGLGGMAEPLRQRGLDVLSWRRRRERPPEEPPRSRRPPRGRWRHAPGKRAS